MSMEYLLENDCLVVSGDGPMDDYYWDECTMGHVLEHRPPWQEEKAYYEKAIITGVSCVGDEAFYSCPNLHTLVVSETVRSIHREAFHFCRNLSSVSFSEGIEAIGEGVFADCTSLMSISLPARLKEIGSKAFANCSALQSVQLSDSVKTIKSRAFENTSIRSLHIPAGVTDIAEDAFLGCEMLSVITADPDNMHYSVENGNLYCSPLQKLQFTQRPTEKIIRVPDHVRVISEFAFSPPPDVLILSEGVKELHCKSIHSIIVKEGIKELPTGLFGASEEIYLPNSISSIKPGTVRKGTMIYAPSGSAAARYAKGNAHLFTAMDEQEYRKSLGC